MTRCTHDSTGKARLFGRESDDMVCMHCAAVFISETHWRLKRDVAIRHNESVSSQFRTDDADGSSGD